MISFFRFKKNRFGVAVVLLIIAFFILNLTDSSRSFKNFFYLISSPVQKKIWETGGKLSNFLKTIWEIRNLKEENKKLEMRNQELLAEITQLKELKKENEILRAALGIDLEKEFKLAFASIISKDASEDIVLINKGFENNILNNSPVITQEKVLLGKVVEVYKNFSRVMLISHPDSIFNAKLQRIQPESDFNDSETSGDILGVIKGKGNLEVYFDLIPFEAEVKENDILITSGQDVFYPKGFLVGIIKETKKSTTSSFQQAVIAPFFHISKIESLFIVLE